MLIDKILDHKIEVKSLASFSHFWVLITQMNMDSYETCEQTKRTAWMAGRLEARPMIVGEKFWRFNLV
ncbi:MAG TPA: hypothetical protein VGN23_00930 [Verrucomicrobiae bacterium]|jgi:hypothetical protein